MYERLDAQVIGNISEIQPPIEIPRDTRGRIRWKTLARLPEQLSVVIEAQARDFLAKGNSLTRPGLTSMGEGGLAIAISTHYPGGFPGLKFTLGIEKPARPKNFWTREITLQEAQIFIDENGAITSQLLKGRQRHNLAGAIRRHYREGGFGRLREDLGADPTRKPNGFWTPEQIKEESTKFFDQFGVLTEQSLRELGYKPLFAAIRKHYPGRLTQLKRELNVRHSRMRNYWTAETIEHEVADLLRQTKALSYGILRRIGRYDLSMAIQRSYPGGITALKEKLEITPNGILDTISTEEANEQLQRLLEETI